MHYLFVSCNIFAFTYSVYSSRPVTISRRHCSCVSSTKIYPVATHYLWHCSFTDALLTVRTALLRCSSGQIRPQLSAMIHSTYICGNPLGLSNPYDGSTCTTRTFCMTRTPVFKSPLGLFQLIGMPLHVVYGLTIAFRLLITVLFLPYSSR